MALIKTSSPAPNGRSKLKGTVAEDVLTLPDHSICCNESVRQPCRILPGLWVKLGPGPSNLPELKGEYPMAR
jgi:hypothetical protein